MCSKPRLIADGNETYSTHARKMCNCHGALLIGKGLPRSGNPCAFALEIGWNLTRSRLGSGQFRADGTAGLVQRSLLSWEKALGVDPRAGTRREGVFLLHLK